MYNDAVFILGNFKMISVVLECELPTTINKRIF